MTQSSFNNFFQNVILKKNIFLVIVVVLIFFISAIILFGDYSSKKMNYQNQNQNKLQKISRAEEYNKSKEELKKFTSSLPKPLISDEIVNEVEDYAIRNNISILDVSSKDLPKRDE